VERPVKNSTGSRELATRLSNTNKSTRHSIPRQLLPNQRQVAVRNRFSKVHCRHVRLYGLVAKWGEPALFPRTQSLWFPHSSVSHSI